MRAIANEWFDVIGISVAIETQLPQLRDLIAHFRQNSGNPNVKVMLGGPIFSLKIYRPTCLAPMPSLQIQSRRSIS
jgi:methanogenic corrinoid protein MtbC1